jgi:hypothetical protein
MCSHPFHGWFVGMFPICSQYVPHVVPSRKPHIMRVYILYPKVYSQVNSCDQVQIFFLFPFKKVKGWRSIFLSLSHTHTHTTIGMNCMGLGGVSHIGKSSLLLSFHGPHFSVLWTWDGRYDGAPLPHWELRSTHKWPWKIIILTSENKGNCCTVLAWPGGLLAFEDINFSLM